jgi:hypothetical protein
VYFHRIVAGEGVLDGRFALIRMSGSRRFSVQGYRTGITRAKPLAELSRAFTVHGGTRGQTILLQFTLHIHISLVSTRCVMQVCGDDRIRVVPRPRTPS